MDLMCSSRLDPDGVRCLGEDWEARFYRAKVVDSDIDAVRVATGLAKLSRPVRLVINEGTAPGDFMWNTYGLVVAGPKVLRLLREGGITGYSTYPVQIHAGDRVIPGYEGIAVLGRAGRLDTVRSKVKYYENADGSKSVVAMEGLYFDPGAWDGSDVFCVQDVPKQVLLVEKVWRLFESASVTNYGLRTLGEFGFGYRRPAKKSRDA